MANDLFSRHPLLFVGIAPRCAYLGLVLVLERGVTVSVGSPFSGLDVNRNASSFLDILCKTWVSFSSPSVLARRLLAIASPLGEAVLEGLALVLHILHQLAKAVLAALESTYGVVYLLFS